MMHLDPVGQIYLDQDEAMLLKQILIHRRDTLMHYRTRANRMNPDHPITARIGFHVDTANRLLQKLGSGSV